MIYYVKEDLFSKKADILVNTVNCVGVMGKGIALEFKNRMPNLFKEYKIVCKNKQLKPGNIFVYRDIYKTVINMATKDHWRNPSQYSWIEHCLLETANYIIFNYLDDKDIRMPLPGCGNGGLDSKIVSLMIEKTFSVIKNNIYVCVYNQLVHPLGL